MMKDCQWLFGYLTRVYSVCDKSELPLPGMTGEVPIPIVLPGEPAAKLKAIFAALNVTEVYCTLFSHIRVFRAEVPLEVLAILEC